MTAIITPTTNTEPTTEQAPPTIRQAKVANSSYSAFMQNIFLKPEEQLKKHILNC